MSGDREGHWSTYEGQSKPVLVDLVLGPLFVLFVSPEVMPCVATTVVDTQPPARVVRERLLAGLWDVERGIQLREFVGGQEHGWL